MADQAIAGFVARAGGGSVAGGVAKKVNAAVAGARGGSVASALSRAKPTLQSVRAELVAVLADIDALAGGGP